MSTNNHLLTSIEFCGETREIDIQFTYGECREYFYRLGDVIYILKKDREKTEKLVIVGGIAALPFPTNDRSTIKELYFRILILDNVIVSFARTTQEDYEALDAALLDRDSTG